jgi:putative endonuclease
MYYTYILESQFEKGRLYVGSTEDLKARLERHNGGFVRSTKPYRPWEVAYYEGHRSKALARQAELVYKTSQGRRQLKKKLGTEE